MDVATKSKSQPTSRLIVTLIMWLGVLFLCSFGLAQAGPSANSYIPPKGMIPDKETAIKGAEAVLTPIYGEGELKKQAPGTVELKGGRWILHGRLHAAQPAGGGLIIEISKKTGCILRVIGTE